MTYNIKTGKEKILRIWIPIIRHGCSGNEVLPSSFLAATSGHYLSREGGREGTSLQEADGDVPLDGVAFSPLY